MKLIKRKTRSRLTDSKLKNFLMLSVTNLTPNIEEQVKCLKSQSNFEVYLLLYQILHLHFIIQGVHKVSLQFKKNY